MKIMAFIQDHNKLNKRSGSKSGILDLVLQRLLFSFSFFHSIFNCNNKSISSDSLLSVKSPKRKDSFTNKYHRIPSREGSTNHLTEPLLSPDTERVPPTTFGFSSCSGSTGNC